ncbi:MAG TPA: hypothetical protein VG317_18145 [Pseudonocardiaceae bacterium]|jgi:hypothetical protein|nr:hypothetical protein [Pseudonocardiaceae bacterium]
MSQPKHALVLHLANSAEPLLIAISDGDAGALSSRLPDLMREGEFETITAANGSTVTVNFAHVFAALVDAVQGIGKQVYGAPERTYGGPVRA